VLTALAREYESHFRMLRLGRARDWAQIQSGTELIESGADHRQPLLVMTAPQAGRVAEVAYRRPIPLQPSTNARKAAGVRADNGKR
jgi:hypothetical protein